MPGLHVSPLPHQTKDQIAARLRAQFRDARFSPQDDRREQAFLHAVALGQPVMVKPLRALVRTQGWADAWLIACVEDERPHADRAVTRVLYYEEPAGSTVIPRALLTLSWRFKDVKPPAQPRPGTCPCGGGEQISGKQR